MLCINTMGFQETKKQHNTIGVSLAQITVETASLHSVPLSCLSAGAETMVWVSGAFTNSARPVSAHITVQSLKRFSFAKMAWIFLPSKSVTLTSKLDGVVQQNRSHVHQIGYLCSKTCAAESAQQIGYIDQQIIYLTGKKSI